VTHPFSPDHFPVELRSRMFKIFLNSALHITSTARPEWLRVRYHQNRIRLFAGKLIVLTAGESGLIWLSVDPDTLLPIEPALSSWSRDTPYSRPAAVRRASYPEYKRPPSTNGYYVISKDPTGRDWSLLQQAHFRYLDLVIQRGVAPNQGAAHEPELLDQLVSMLEQQDNTSLESRVRRSRLDSSVERQRRLAQAPKVATRVTERVTVFQRNADVIAEVLRRARGICELCRKNAPFCRLSDGTPYLEVHHCIPLAADGEDTVENAIALCPTCHRRLHYGLELLAAIKEAQDALRRLS
jgi:5-methylcytosine-specific restriction endonuclease McrA